VHNKKYSIRIAGSAYMYREPSKQTGRRNNIVFLPIFFLTIFFLDISRVFLQIDKQTRNIITKANPTNAFVKVKLFDNQMSTT
jgi:hypothetical protein